MFCPVCSLENSDSNQFCRSCGTDLRPVKLAMSKPDSVTASAVTAREEIGRAFADKIRNTRSAEELSEVVENVLPEIEKFLESPEEKRMRRMRAGSILAFIGLGAAIACLLVVTLLKFDDFFLIVGVGGIAALFFGLALIINGMYFTVPEKIIESGKASHTPSTDPAQFPSADTNELVLPEGRADEYISVTDATTRHLHKKEKITTD